MQIPRIMIAAAASGSGKTTIACGLMAAFLQQGLSVVAAKCGPDYIDPMFHRQVLGIPSQNLDLFFCDERTITDLFTQHAKDGDITVLEGVMGYYDGLSLMTDQASSYAVAKGLGVPVILVVPCRGMALSALAMIKGFIEFREDSNIQGILLNRVSEMLYPRLKEMIEEGLKELGYCIPVVGYVPESELLAWDSRHLGLVTPAEIPDVKLRLAQLGELLAETVDLEQIAKIARRAPDVLPEQVFTVKRPAALRLGVARDAAFCFYYQDNLKLLEQLGCELVEFSPLADQSLPDGISGLLLGGGYPELHAGQLSGNEDMKLAIRTAVRQGMPCLAECGGFMYLHGQMEGADGLTHPMAGVIKGTAFRKERLVRFGYIDVTGLSDGVYLKSGERLRGHEFHYWDSSSNGTDCLAEKPDKKWTWQCIHMTGTLFAGYPHIHFYSNLVFAERFVEQMQKYAERKEVYYGYQVD